MSVLLEADSCIRFAACSISAHLDTNPMSGARVRANSGPAAGGQPLDRSEILKNVFENKQLLVH